MAFDPINFIELKKIRKKFNVVENELNVLENEIDNIQSSLSSFTSMLDPSTTLDISNSKVSRIAVITDDNIFAGVTIDDFKSSLDIPDISQVLKYVDFLNAKIDILHGLDSKIVGYLYGGYKGGVSIDHIQRYDTIQEISTDIYTTGKKVAYVPGITTAKKGYFTWSDDNTTWYWSEFDFSNEILGAQIDQSLGTRVQVSAYNMGIGDTALVSSGKSQLGADSFKPSVHVSATWIFDASNLTFTEISIDTLNNILHTTRQALNNDAAAFIVNMDESPSNHYIYTWVTQTAATDSTNKFNRCQYPVGLSKDKSIGYWIDRTCMAKVKYDGNTIVSVTSLTYKFKAHFGESHSLQNYRYGFVMAGYDDNLGDFGGGQHGYTEKMEWSTETTSVLPHLAFPQSSGEMVQH